MGESHRDLVRAVSSARFAYLIGERGFASSAGAIGIETGVQHGSNRQAVAIDVDVTRSRSGPGEIYRVAAHYLVTPRTERELNRCRCRSHSRCRCWSWRGRRC